MIIWEIRSEGQGVVRADAVKAKAEAFADRIGAVVVEASVEIGQRVSISHQSHRKPGKVVAFQGAKIVVSFVPRAGAAPVQRAFPVDAVRR
jgi:hypothetical protein